MGYIIKDRIEVSIFINDIEYPLDRDNTLSFLLIATSAVVKLPALSFSVIDTTNTLSKIGLQDGAPIRVSIKALTGKTRVYLFRKFSHTREYIDGAAKYTIHGYYDSPLYWAATTYEGIKGSSNEVLQQIAAKCGLKYNGIATNDNQIWLPQNKSYSSFAKEIASRGYISDASCMAIGVDLLGTLNYRNINEPLVPKFQLIAYQYKEDAITVVDLASVSNSGLNNNLMGYNNLRYAQSLEGDLHTAIDKLSFTKNTTNPDLNTKVKQVIGRGSVRFGPINAGNVHSNYEKASYQNARYKNMFSQNLEALVSQPTDISLFVGINLATQTEDSGRDVVNNGLYLVSGKALYVQGSTYAEKLLLSRHGTNEKQVEK